MSTTAVDESEGQCFLIYTMSNYSTLLTAQAIFMVGA
jgi:hypothetical protein